MINMTTQKYIKQEYEKGEKSLRKIAAETGVSFETVQKYAYKENWTNEKALPSGEENYPKLGEYIKIIDEWLENDKKEPRKQRHTGKLIFERLKKECEYKGSYSSVQKYVRKKKLAMKTNSEGFLPLAKPMGYAQIDFGELKYYDIFGKAQKAYALTISFVHSNKGFTQVFKSCNQECLLEGMKRIFEYIGDVPICIKCDNMSTAVAEILKGNERIITDGFSRFMLNYRFKSDFCNYASGNEKGNIENNAYI